MMLKLKDTLTQEEMMLKLKDTLTHVFPAVVWEPMSDDSFFGYVGPFRIEAVYRPDRQASVALCVQGQYDAIVRVDVRSPDLTPAAAEAALLQGLRLVHARIKAYAADLAQL